MKNKEYFKKYLINLIIVVVVFSLLLGVVKIVEYQNYKQNYNNKINGLLYVIKEENPSIDVNELLEVLNDDKAYENVLGEYGYDLAKDDFINANDKNSVMFNIVEGVLLLVLCCVLLYLFMKYDRKMDKEIAKIIKCIEDINHKNYDLKLEDISEDCLSILKEEIYKMTIMLKEQAENSLQDKIDLKDALQNISHQLKTPLTSINIMLDNLIDEPDMDEEVRNRFTRQIKREITNINFLVQAILKLSKFEANTIQFMKEEHNVEDIIDEVVQNVANLCDLKNVEVVVSNKYQNKIVCDLKWQVEALTNILKNAVEYSKEGDKVLISCEDNNVYTQIKIKDFGIGMDNEDTLNIFKRFYKGKDAAKDSIGIGLALAKVIIEEDQGRVSVESKKHKGTTFTIKYYKG